MRVHPIVCIFAILGTLIVFCYFAFRDKIQSEYSSVTKLTNKTIISETDSLSLTPSKQSNLWEISKIRILYESNSAILRTINDKIINSDKFNSFLFNFLDRSYSSKQDILAQSNYFTKDFNATNFLSTLFYTKYEGKNSKEHVIIAKGKTKRTASLLQMAIFKAIPMFCEDSEGSILSITETQSLKDKIDLLEVKASELIIRINLETKKTSDDLSLISVNSEISLLEDELSELLIVKADLFDTKKQAIDVSLLENNYIRNYGKIEEYVLLIEQLSRLSKNNPESASYKEILSNKAKLSSLLIEEYNNAVIELSNEIQDKQEEIKILKEKVFNSSIEVSHSKIPEHSLLEKVNSSLEKLKREYYTNLNFWNSSKNQISFSLEN